MTKPKEKFERFINEQTNFSYQMKPIIYLSIMIAPVIFQIINSKVHFTLPHYAQLSIAYLPILSTVLFIYHAYYLLKDINPHKKPRFIFLLAIPFVNLVYQFYALFPLGKTIKIIITKSNSSMFKFTGYFSQIVCLLFLLLNIVIQVRIQYQISNVRPSYNINIIEWVLRGSWIYVSSIMYWDYSKVINQILDYHNNAIPADAKSRAAE